jgi:hypothetical protein
MRLSQAAVSALPGSRPAGRLIRRPGQDNGLIRISGVRNLVAERRDDVGGERRVASGTRGEDAASHIPPGFIAQAGVSGHPGAKLRKLPDCR